MTFVVNTIIGLHMVFEVGIILNANIILLLQGGDADTNGAVAGAMLACELRHTNKLPKTWTQFQHKEWLDSQIMR